MVTMLIPTMLFGLSALTINKHLQSKLDDRAKSLWRRIFSLSENSTINILIWITGVPYPSTTLKLNVMSLFWNIWQHESPLRQICINFLKNKTEGFYWIDFVGQICKEYDFPSPLSMLTCDPPSKKAWKKFCREKILQGDNEKLIIDIFRNNYFEYVHPNDFSIDRKRIHPLLFFPTTAYDMIRMNISNN